MTVGREPQPGRTRRNKKKSPGVEARAKPGDTRRGPAAGPGLAAGAACTVLLDPCDWDSVPEPPEDDPTLSRPVAPGGAKRARAKPLPRSAIRVPPLGELDEWELPAYVRNCANNMGRRDSYWFWAWKRQNTETRYRIPYVCKSWRCPYGCRVFCSRQLFARTKQAFDKAHERNCELAKRRKELVAELRALPSQFGSRKNGRWRMTASQRRAFHKQRRLLKLKIARGDAAPAPGKTWKGVVHLVITLDPSLHALCRVDPDAVFVNIGHQSELFSKALKRWMVASGMESYGSDWMSTIEVHLSGVPHINMLIYAPEWAGRLRKQKHALIHDGKLRLKEAIVMEPALQELATKYGFGYMSTAEACRPRQLDRLIGYDVKVAANLRGGAAFRNDGPQDAEGLTEGARLEREMHRLWNTKLLDDYDDAERAIGEAAKATQIPVRAPFRFRRVRSGKGFLPEKNKNPEVTGCVVRRRRTKEGDEEIAPFVRSNDQDYMDRVGECCRREEEIAREEENELSRQVSNPDEVSMRNAVWIFETLVKGKPPTKKPAITSHYFGKDRPQPLSSAVGPPS